MKIEGPCHLWSLNVPLIHLYFLIFFNVLLSPMRLINVALCILICVTIIFWTMELNDPQSNSVTSPGSLWCGVVYKIKVVIVNYIFMNILGIHPLVIFAVYPLTTFVVCFYLLVYQCYLPKTMNKRLKEKMLTNQCFWLIVRISWKRVYR